MNTRLGISEEIAYFCRIFQCPYAVFCQLMVTLKFGITSVAT